MDTAPPDSRIDFAYAFATPHRLTIGRPNQSDRTLCDLQPGYLRLSWTYDDLHNYPLGAFRTPPTLWGLNLTPQLDGESFAESTWARLDGWIPGLVNDYSRDGVRCTLEALGGETAALVRVAVSNTGDRPRQVVLRCESTSWGENHGWLEPGVVPADFLVAGWLDRADRVLVLGLGADAYSLTPDGRAAGARLLLLVWNLAPGETRQGWLVRPYRAYAAELPVLRAHDWAAEWDAAVREWHELLAGACDYAIPDPGVEAARRACFADLFIMREPVGHGYVASVPGTEVYRAPNSFESAVVSVALDQAGLHREAARGYRLCLDMQEPDGNWNDARGWGHLMWGGAGFKAWAAAEHFRLTGDRRYLARVYPRLLASSRWQERQRRRTRGDGPTAGLMPAGMGDCGLLDDGDLYGIFLPHNIWAVFADRLALEAARLLGRDDEAAELAEIYQTARADLLRAIELGAIDEDGYRWIPGVPGKTSGSRWGVLNALWPTELLAGDDDLVTGTLRQIESRRSPGGMPLNTGWMPDGTWVAITLDNVAEAHLALGHGDAAADYLIATLNHATPLVTWCEERGPEPGASQCTGDRQHLWTPVAVVRCLRDCLVRERGDRLELSLGTPRDWLGSGRPVGVTGAPTHFGPVSFAARYDAERGDVVGRVTFPRRRRPAEVRLFIRLPEGLAPTAVDEESGAVLSAGDASLVWSAPRGEAEFVVRVEGG